MAEEFSLERIAKLVSDLEQELSGAPAGTAKVAALRAEIVALKQTLASVDPSSPAPAPSWSRGCKAPTETSMTSSPVLRAKCCATPLT